MSKALFEYHLRISPRGKTVRLRVTVQNGLEVVVPRGYDEKKVPAVLDRQRHWIRTALERAELQRKCLQPEPEWRLPTKIELPALGTVWHLTARESSVAFVSVRELGHDRLLVFGAIGDEAACRVALARWLIRQAREHLVPRLEAASRKRGLAFHRVLIRRQRTRWASYSRRGTVSLNAKLLFLPPELVDYVMVHELCHAVEMNHSERFWALLARHCPGYHSLHIRLRDMWKSVPRWAGA